MIEVNRDPDLTFTAFGEAKTKGSTFSFVPKKGGQPITRANGSMVVVTKNDAGEPAKAWAAIVASAAADAMMEAGLAPAGKHEPVMLGMLFYRPRPGGHFGSGRNAGVLKDSAPPFPTTKPDVDKLVRCVLDAVKGVLWHDDGQVVAAPAYKLWGSPARCEMRLWRLNADDGPEPTVAEASPTSQSALFVA